MLTNKAHEQLVEQLTPKATSSVERERYTRDDLKSAAKRSKLPARGAGNKPFYFPLSETVSLGYQLSTRSGVAGKWLKREYIGKVNGQHKYRAGTLAVADDIAGAGVDIDAAVELARGKLVASDAVTVRDIVEQYKGFRGKHGNKVKRNRDKGYDSLRWHVLGLDSDMQPREGFDTSLADTKLAKVTSEQLIDWRTKLIDAQCYSTAHRVWHNLHSALEQAKKKASNNVTSSKAWDDVPNLAQTHVARQVHFSDEQALQIIDDVRKVDAPAADYFEGLYRTGQRPGDELFALSVRDYNATTRKLSIQGRTEETSSKTGARTISLDAEGVALFERLTAGRKADAPMFADHDGSRLDNSSTRRWKQLLVNAGAGADAVPYAFRHTFISRRLEKGMPSGILGKHCGTSGQMIERTYAKFLPSETERWLNETAPKAKLAKRAQLKLAA